MEMENRTFKIHNRGNRQAQHFDKDTIEIIKNGEKINVYQSIQDAREDTELYSTLEKYGSLKRMELDTELVYEDVREMKDLRGIFEQQKRANELWNNLPLEVRREFGHSQKEFIDKGEDWLKRKIDTEKHTVDEKPVIIKKPKEEIEIKGDITNG